MKATYTQLLSDYDELQKQCSMLRSRCQQLESERLPLIAQLEFADRNLRLAKKQQQQAAMTTSTTVHHQPPLQSIENSNNKSVSRLVRSPSLDMRVMRRTSKSSSLNCIFTDVLSLDDKMMTMDDTRSLDHDDLALLAHKNQSFNNYVL